MFPGARGFVLKIVPSKTRDGELQSLFVSMLNLPAEVDGSNRLADLRESSSGISKLTVLIKQQLKRSGWLDVVGKAAIAVWNCT